MGLTPRNLSRLRYFIEISEFVRNKLLLKKNLTIEDMEEIKELDHDIKAARGFLSNGGTRKIIG